MAQNANTSTLFHLVPLNELSHETLAHPDNRRFVSLSDVSDEKTLGLEVGFHVSSVPGRVIARLGRNGDLILQQRNISAVHVAFELHPETLLVLLSVRAKHTSSVIVKPDRQDREKIEGDCVLSYGKKYEIRIKDYSFHLVWRQIELRALAIQDYSKALQ